MPIVMRGSDFGSWVNNSAVPISQIYLYKYNPNATPNWIPLRFQIDKRRKTNLLHNVFNYDSWRAHPCFTHPEIPCPFADVCSLTYFEANQTNCESWDKPDVTSNKRRCQPYQDEWGKNYLLSTDEIVVMARDMVGSQRDVCPVEWLDPKGNPGLFSSRQELEVSDNGETFYIYAYQWTQPPPSDPDLVATGSAPSLALDASCTPCVPPYGANNDKNLCGTITAEGVSTDLPGYKLHLASNWLVDRIARRYGGTDAELVQELSLRLLSEDHRNFSCNNAPRRLGTKQGATLRVISSAQGAQSGFATVRVEKGYEALYETEFELRVHDVGPLGPDGVTARLSQVHDDVVIPTAPNLAPISAIWTPDRLGLTSPTYFDLVHVNPVTYPDAGLANIDPDKWTQLSVSGHGGIATYMLDDPRRGGINADSQAPFYLDNPQVHGNFGRTWNKLSCMQDGFDNDGGCDSDPESLSLRFRRMWYRMFTVPIGSGEELQSVRVKADDEYDAARTPYAMEVLPLEQASSGVSCGGGGSPCVPVVTVSITGDGETNLSNSPSASPSGCIPSINAAYGITRQISGGSEQLIGIVKPSETFRDVLVQRGLPHTYRSYSIARGGVTSNKSAPVTVTPIDTAAPPAPVLTATALDHGAQVDFEACVGTGTSGANIYVSSSSGGPYNKVNTTPIPAFGMTHYTVSGLQNSATYYVVAKLIDHAGNMSPYSAEVSVAPHP